MKWIILFSLCAIAVFLSDNGIAASTCSALGSRLNQTQLSSTLSGKLVCASKIGALTGNDRWAEEHRTTGELWEQGKGTTSTVHPPTKVGTWSIVGTGSNAAVQYNYSGGTTYTWSVFNSSGTLTFCTTNETTVIATGSAITPNPSSTNACGF